ncbi:MAG: S1 RNA-binding domain-containing protein [Streptococcaceae bacterium]|jgi:predicted RNA-binding protein (virulence factor B family)|nr:S1 RNA-binding domain-containing protein [Streptococcaceae bacterium]
MKNWLGSYITATVVDVKTDYYFLQSGDDVFRMLKSEGAYSLGDSVSGFAYEDRLKKNWLTTKEPAATMAHFGWGVVTEVRRDLGVFVDIGLPGKDMVVSVDELQIPAAQWPKVGDQLYVKLTKDNKNRLWAHLAWHEDFWQLANPAFDNMKNQELRGIIYRIREAGTFVYLPDKNMLGFIHPSELTGGLRIGQELTLRVIGFRSEDRVLYLSAKPRGFEMLGADGQMILAYLENMGGKMGLNDKSAPEEIKTVFGISKGQFKKALGGLMKAGKVKQTQEGTELK